MKLIDDIHIYLYHYISAYEKYLFSFVKISSKTKHGKLDPIFTISYEQTLSRDEVFAENGNSSSKGA